MTRTIGTAPKLCLALDKPHGLGDAAIHLVGLRERVEVVKVNSFFVQCHRSILEMASELGYETWVDLKFHDTRETVSDEVKKVSDLGVDYTTIHLSGCSEMIEAAAKASRSSDLDRRTLLLGITVLTSISQKQFNTELRVPGSILEHVLHLAKLGLDNGIDGIVCSAQEVAAVRDCVGNDMILVTPGIRFPEGDVHEQKRVMSPGDAVRNKSNIVVMGRPLIQGGVEVAKRARSEMDEAFAEGGGG